MRKIIALGVAICAVLVSAFAAAWASYEEWPFSVKIRFAQWVERPPYMKKGPLEKRVPIQGRESFAKWVVAAANCQTEFMQQVQDQPILKKIKSMGIKGVQLDEMGTPDGTWQVPRGMVSVFGADVSEIHFWGDSGSEFIIKVAMSPKSLIERIGAGSPPRYIARDGYSAVLLTRPISELQPLPQFVFVAEADKPNQAYLGCRMYDF